MKLCATGHRPEKLGGYSADAATRLRAFARYQLMTLSPERVTSGMALGWDTAIALAALDMGFPLICAVPFAGQELKWPIESQRLYHSILARAEAVEVICSGGYSATKMYLRDVAMVNSCDFVLACWDGSNSGTGNTVRYAWGEGVTVLNCYNDLTGCA